MSSPADSKAPASAFESPTFGEDSSFHVEQPVGSMSISPCGRDVVLASKEGLHVIDLDSPYSPPRYLPHHTPWEVADVQWSPFARRDYWVVSTSNQKALVWNLAMKTWENSIEYVLHAHSRAITDINFSAHHPDIIATCAVDSFVHCWDLRIPARPVVSFSDWFAGATQVKWNRQDPHIIASSHDKYLRIWDDRMGARPLKSIEAHSTKIYGIDWNRMRREAIVTCSLDKTIKFWNYEAECESPEKMIETSFPVWRARHTPFGFGVLAMPQRGDNDLHLYSRRRTDEHGPGEGLPLVHSFPGHKGQVKEFLWRPRGSVADGIDHREFQLVSWGADRELRLHRVDPDILRAVGYEKGKSFDFTMNLTRQGSVYKTFRDDPPDEELGDSMYAETVISAGARPQISAGIGTNNVSTRYSRPANHGIHIEPRVGMQGRSQFRTDLNPIAWMRGVKISGWDIETLGDEITHVGEKFSKVDFESVDVRQRRVTISLHGPWGDEGGSLFLKLDIKFPSDYPRTAIPTFRIQKTAAMTDELSESIASELRTISETYLSRKRGCLEGVLRYLLGECNLEESIALVLGENMDTIKSPVSALDDDESSDEDEDVGQFEKEELGMSTESLRPINANVMVPVARVCGATWSPDGRLVCFFPSKKDKTGSLFDSLGLKDFGRFSRNDKVFEGFGRLQASSPSRLPPGKGPGSMSVTDDGGSDYSDDSDTESSSSSSSSDSLSCLPNRFQAAPMWRSLGGLGSGTYRTRSADNSQLSTAGGPATVKSDSGCNIISIHDFSDLLPAKKSLASQYKVFGYGAEICAHNAAVAADAGYHHLAQVWGLLKLVLHNQGRPRDHTFNAGSLALDSNTKKEEEAKLDGSGVKSGSRHILQQFGSSATLQGGKWLIDALIEHFERIGDVQMLAMLSCILHEQMLRQRTGRRGDREVSFNQNNGAFAVDFFSSKTPDSKYQAATPLTSYSKDGSVDGTGLQTPDITAEHLHSIATTPYSSATSPMPTSTSKPLDNRRTPNLSISASPDSHHISRTGSGIGTALASSWSRSFTFGPSSGSSPPVNTAKKKPSPNGSLNVPSAITWSATQIFNKAVSALPDYLNTSAVVTSSQAQSETDSEKKKCVRKLKVNVSLKNRAAFDPDESSSGPFINRKQETILRNYRNAYADLLFVWDMPIQRSEVLKIGATMDSVKEGPVSRRRQPSQTLPLSVPKQKGSGSENRTPGSTLDVQRHCSECGSALYASLFSSTPRKEPGSKISKQSYLKCPSCSAVQPPSAHIPCVICGESIAGMFIPCLECGHVCCVECHRQWFSLSSPEEDDLFTMSDLACPSPCGCSCTEHSNIIYLPSPIRTPQNEKSQPPNRYSRRRSEVTAPSQLDIMAGQTDDDLEAWRGAALTKGFGGGLSRVLTTANSRRNSSVNRRYQFDRMDTM